MKEHLFDPPIKRDKTCAECGKPRPKIAVTYDDPFCSSDCCKQWYFKHGPKKQPKKQNTKII